MPSVNPTNSIFISYSRRDKPFVQKLVKAFNDAGRDVWIDWEDIPPMADWRNEIHSGIDGADDFVFIISPDSVESEVCSEELTRAVQYNKRLVPLLYREVKDYKDVHSSLSSHNWIFFNDETQFEQSFTRLIEALDTDLEHTRAHTRLLTRALEWDKKGRNDSFKLRGQDLQDAERWIAQASSKVPRVTELQSEYVYASRQSAEQRKRLTIGMLMVGLVVSLALSLIAVVQTLAAQSANHAAQAARLVSEQQEANARSLLLADRAQQRYMEGQVELAIALALEANQLGDPPAQSQLILSELAYSPGVRKFYEGHKTSVNSVAISPDNRTALTGSFDGTSVYWDMETGAELVRYVNADRMPVRSVAFSRRDDHVAIAALWDWSIALWDTRTGKELRRLGGIRSAGGHNGVVNSIVVNVDGSRLLSGSNDGTMILWDMTTGEPIRHFGSYDPLRGNGQAILSVDMSQDGRLAVSGGLDNRVRIWDLERGVVLHELMAHRDDVLAVAFSPDGQSVVSGSKDASLILWNTETGGQVVKYAADGSRSGHIGAVRSVAFSPDNTTIVSAAEDGSIIVWDKFSGAVVRYLGGIDRRVQELSIAITSDGRRVLAGSSNGRLTIWDITNEAVTQYYEGHLDSVNSLAFHPNGQQMVTGAADLDLFVWDVTTGGLLATLAGHEAPVNTVAYDPDGSRLVSGGEDGLLIVWNAEQLTEAARYLLDAPVTQVVFAETTDRLFVALRDEQLVALDMATGALQQRYEGHRRRIIALTLSADGERLAAGSADGEILVWDIATGQQQYRFNQTATGESLQRVLALAHHPLRPQLLFGTLDGILGLIDLQTGSLSLLERSPRPIWSVDYSPDGRFAVSGDADGTLTLWDVENASALRRFREHRSTIMAVAYSPDGAYVATASRDHTALLWDMPTLETLLNWTRENRYVQPLTCEQRAQYRILSPDCEQVLQLTPLTSSERVTVAQSR